MNEYKNQADKFDPFYVDENLPRVLPESSVKQLEQIIGANLPNDYRTFLTHYGGVAFRIYPVFNIQGTANPDSKSILNNLYGVLPDTPMEDLATLYLDYQGRIPSELLPIGEDPGGNIICLGIKGTRRGKVYFWDHHGEIVPENGEEPGDSNLFFVADSFAEFFFSLQPYS